MNERERWIVYPLLFLALGAALRDKLSDHTRTKTLECQELIVYGEESASLPGVPLVRIGGMERTTASSPHLGEIVVYGVNSARQPATPLVQIGGRKGNSPEAANHGQIAVNGVINAFVVEAEGMQASQINADNYFFRRVPFAPLVKTVPGVSPADQLRALQLQQPNNTSPGAPKSSASGDTKQPVPAEESPASSDADQPSAKATEDASPKNGDQG